MFGFEGSPNSEVADTAKQRPHELTDGKEKNEIPPEKQLETLCMKKQAEFQAKMNTLDKESDFPKADKIAAEAAKELQKIMDENADLTSKLREGIAFYVEGYLEFTYLNAKGETKTEPYHLIGQKHPDRSFTVRLSKNPKAVDTW